MRANNNFALRRSAATSLMGAVIAGTVLLLAPASMHAGEPTAPELSIIGATGVAGSTVSVTFALSDDAANEAAGAGIDLTFDPEVLEYFGSNALANCTIDDRISDTHILGGNPIQEPGTLDVEIFPNPTIFPVVPFENGNLASCDFHIKAGVPTGTTTLVIETNSSFLNNAQGAEIPGATFVNGDIIIVEGMTPTPTATGVPTGTVTATNTVGVATATRTVSQPTPTNTTNGGNATPTNTVNVGTPTNTVNIGTPTNTVNTGGTPTNTPGTQIATATRTSGTPVNTATRTGTAAPTRQAEDDGCNIAASDQGSSAGTMMLLLAPALLIWARRRRF